MDESVSVMVGQHGLSVREILKPKICNICLSCIRFKYFIHRFHKYDIILIINVLGSGVYLIHYRIEIEHCKNFKINILIEKSGHEIWRFNFRTKICCHNLKFTIIDRLNDIAYKVY